MAALEVNAEGIDTLTLDSQSVYAESDVDKVVKNFDKKSTERLGRSKTVLHVAAAEGRKDIVSLLVSSNQFDVNIKDDVEWSPLDEAVREGHLDVAQLLLTKGAVGSKYMNVGLMEACESGNVEKARICLKGGASLTYHRHRLLSGYTPLHVAVANGKTEIVTLLLDNGANVNIKDENKLTPLQVACSKNQIEIVELLLSRGAAVIHESSGVTTIDSSINILAACTTGDLEGVHYCIQRDKSDVAIQDKRGRTPLHIATVKGRIDIVSLLVKNGADLNIRDKNDYTPLDLAVKNNEQEIISYLESKGAKYFQKVPLHKFVAQGNLNDLIEVASRKKLDVNIVDENGDSPMHIAVKKMRIDFASFLVECGADTNIKNGDGYTPLHIAARKKDTEMMMLLMKSKGDISIEDKDGFTPHDILIVKKDQKTIVAICELILGKAMKEGHVSIHIVKMLLLGPPAVGKTSFVRLLFNLSAPLVHHSTGIAARPTRAIERIAGKDGGREWVVVNMDLLMKLIAEATHLLEQSKEISFDVPRPAFEEIDNNTSDQTNDAEFKEKNTNVEPNGSDNCSGSPIKIKTVESVAFNINKCQSTNKPPAVVSDESLVPDTSYYPKELLSHLASRNTSDELHNSTWVHVLDSGGQPQFADISRAFVRGNSVNIIAMKLTKSLLDKPKFKYSLNGKVLNHPRELQLTYLELIQQFVHSIASSARSSAGTATGKEMVSFKPYIVIIGTCYDYLKGPRSVFSSKSVESLAEKNAKLIEALKDFKEHLLFYNVIGNELIFPVDNTCIIHRKQISEDIRKRIMSTANVGFMVNIPIRWYVFELKVKEVVDQCSHQSHGMITVTHCKEIGTKLGMEKSDVMECIAYLNSITLFLYLPEVLPDIVFTNHQYLLDIISALVRVSFIDNNKEKLLPQMLLIEQQTQLRKFCEDGLFKAEFLDLLSLPFYTSLFVKEDLVKLLQFTRILAPVVTSPDASLTQYFLPVVLSSNHPDSDLISKFSKKRDPLILKFPYQVVPQGLFPATIVSLLGKRTPENMPVFELNTSCQQLRFAIQLLWNETKESVLLVERFHWIEVYYSGLLSKYCLPLRELIEEAISSCADLLSYEAVALECIATVPCRQEHTTTGKKQEHLCNSGNTGSAFHPTVLRKEPEGYVASCPVQLDLTRLLTDDKQTCWLPKIQGGVPRKEDLLRELVDIAYQWKELGELLGVPNNVLDELKVFPGSPLYKLGDTMQAWLELPNKALITWETVLSAVEGPLRNRRLAFHIRKSLKDICM